MYIKSVWNIGEMMKILVIGSGGREHALAKKFMESPQVEEVFVAPGNSGMEKDGIQIVDISELSNDKLVEFAQNQNIGLTFVGPETALMNGVVDAFIKAELPIFGPNKMAAELEGSKDFAKSIMKKYGVPTADYATFDSLEPALAYLDEKGVPLVIKADGLAAGKGVTVAFDIETAKSALADIFSGSQGKVVIEEFLDGEEFSLFSFVHDGKIYPMPIAQDHKRAFDGDKGPNTGGMGAYSPVLHISKEVVNEALEKVVKPTVAGMIEEGKSFTVVLPRLKSDLAQVIIDILAGNEPTLEWLESGVTLGVVVAAEGYPSQAKLGLILPEIPEGLNVYYAGVSKNENNQLISSGGRVYLVSETGEDVKSTQKLLYEKLDKLENDGFFYRHDIGSRAI